MYMYVAVFVSILVRYVITTSSLWDFRKSELNKLTLSIIDSVLIIMNESVLSKAVRPESIERKHKAGRDSRIK